MHMVIEGKLSLDKEEITLLVEGEYEKYASNPADDYVKAKEVLLKVKEEK